MECFLCERGAVQECARCGALYCDDHGEALCERCSDPALALPSYQVYRGSLLALIVGSVFALWLLISPPGGGDLDAAPQAPPNTGTPVVLPPATATPTSTTTPTPTALPNPTATPPPAGAPAPAAAPAPAPAGGVTEYTVVEGDSLFLIAEQLIEPGGNVGDFVLEITELNGITDPGQIGIGEVLQIPAQ